MTEGGDGEKREGTRRARDGNSRMERRRNEDGAGLGRGVKGHR